MSAYTAQADEQVAEGRQAGAHLREGAAVPLLLQAGGEAAVLGFVEGEVGLGERAVLGAGGFAGDGMKPLCGL